MKKNLKIKKFVLRPNALIASTSVSRLSSLLAQDSCPVPVTLTQLTLELWPTKLSLRERNIARRPTAVRLYQSTEISRCSSRTVNLSNQTSRSQDSDFLMTSLSKQNSTAGGSLVFVEFILRVKVHGASIVYTERYENTAGKTLGLC